jgi:peptide/nickel transport system permease protein
LTLLSVVILVPLGLVSGIISSIRPDEPLDHSFRLLAFIGTSFPPFVLGLVLLAVFYAGLRLFPPGRLGINSEILISSESFKIFTGMLTVDGILNGRLDITLEALKHLFLPVFTLSLTHWATLGRVMRASMLEEYGKPYIIAARARGIAEHSITWRHTMRNALLPALTSTALTAAALISGVFVIEVIFNLHGISKLATSALGFIPDVPLALGIAIYSVFLVLPIMLALDLLQAIVDPRIREGLSGS